MAARSNSKSGSKKTSNKKTNNKSKSTYNKTNADKGRTREILLFVYLAFSVFLICSNIGICGIVGETVSNFFFGVFGTINYIIPFYIFLSAAFLLANNFKRKVVKKVIWLGICLMTMAFICQLLSGTEETTAKSLYNLGADSRQGGGVIFGGFIVFMHGLIGTAGTVIITVLLCIIDIIMVLDISLIDIIKKFFSVSFGRDDDYDDTYENSISQNEVKTGRRKNVLGSIKVYADDDTKEASKNGKSSGKRKNVRVEDEEIHELKPDKDASMDFFMFDDEKESENSDLSDIENMIENPKRKRKTRVKEETDLNVTELKPEKIPIENDSYSNMDDSYSFDNMDSGNYTVSEKTSSKNTGIAKTDESTGNIKVKDNSIKKYKLPPVNLLKSGRKKSEKNSDASVRETAMKLKSTLESFGVNVTITDYSCGPAVTRYEMQPEQGVKVSKILGLADDIKLNLAAADIRIEAPIPGKAAIGIEVPNKENQTVYFRDLIDNDIFMKFPSKISFAVGKDISGQVVVTDIAKMPHLLIAGATGSGKSVCINTLIMSILYKANPDEVKLIMIDPKMVELTAYNGIPHLLIPVVTDPKKAAGALNWAVMEMTNRYKLFAQYNVRNIAKKKKKVEEVLETGEVSDEELKKMPQIVVIVDELADLMMVAHGEVEDAIVRLSQLARAAGIHLVIATQRPSVDVITGLIKANVPSRIAFAVSSGVDSRTILDMNGAEKLLGKGDMLFYPTGYPKPVRVQGAFVSDEEVLSVVNYIKKQCGEISYDEDINKSIETASAGSGSSQTASGTKNGYDEYFEDAARFIIEKDKASIGMLQRVFKIGFNRAARIMDQLYEAGVVGPEEGTKPRKILMSMDEFDTYMSA